MRKRLISVCIAVILIFSICGCAQTVEYALAAETEGKSIDNMAKIEMISNYGVEVKIKNEEEYESFVSRLEEFTDYRYLWIDLVETDTYVYLDDILDYHNFDYLQIRNGGSISARDMQGCYYFRAEIELSHVFAIDEDMLSHLISNELYGQDKIVIELDNRYRGKLPIEELLNYQYCTNVILIWDDDAEGAGLLDVQEDMENLKEWDYLQSVQQAETGCLKSIYRLNDVDYSYTGYEFYDCYEESKMKIQAAFICVKDRESNGGKYFDIIDIPVDKFSDEDSLDVAAYHRIDISDDLNLDGCRDLVFNARNDGLYPVTFLWDKEEKRYIYDESAADSLDCVGIGEGTNAEVYIQDESHIDTEQVISDFLSMDSVEFQENYNKDDLYQSGILYCGHEAWKYDGNQVDAFQEPGDYYSVANITAIRFYKEQPVLIYLNMNINDQSGQYEEKISIDYHTDYAVSIYSKPGDNGLPCIQEISFVKIELCSGEAPRDLYQYLESDYYKVRASLIGETWILSPDGEKAVCVSNGGLPKHPSQIFIWHKDNKPLTVFRETWELRVVGWIDNDHLVCDVIDIAPPILVHLERNEMEKITEERNFDTYGAKYSIQGSCLIAQPYVEEPYQWQILEKDGEIYIVEPD